MKKLLILVLVSFFFLPYAKGQGNKMQALFIYNFSKLIEWPDDKEGSVFKIGVFGPRSTFDEINGLLKGKQAGAKSIQVEYFNSPNDITDCHILFLPDIKAEIFQDVKEKFSGKPTLIITNAHGMIERGAGINFKVVEGRQSFEISNKNIQTHQLFVSGKLISLGISK